MGVVVSRPGTEEENVTPTWDDIDTDALRETMRFSGALSEVEAVNLALRVYAARHRSRAEAERERERRSAQRHAC
ncbi:type II toxin-antitoxin system VapB family antitoxin [Nocardiopsis kunsanensis]|uniref:type II toxin-antitoxin system VapB family antitoxin n=1 Tax=Nocardiopsis kunsanensis TaxID=141693 RepID=UPI001E42CFD3|nr:type II toxin-antitoxin system VapB family antitoxin [Nocardiopsis kunsanensis]